MSRLPDPRDCLDTFQASTPNSDDSQRDSRCATHANAFKRVRMLSNTGELKADDVGQPPGPVQPGHFKREPFCYACGRNGAQCLQLALPETLKPPSYILNPKSYARSERPSSRKVDHAPNGEGVWRRPWGKRGIALRVLPSSCASRAASCEAAAGSSSQPPRTSNRLLRPKPAKDAEAAT